MKQITKIFFGFVGALLGLASMSAHAVIDTTAITAATTDAGAAVAVIGAAVVVVMVGIKVYKWIRGAL